MDKAASESRLWIPPETRYGCGRIVPVNLDTGRRWWKYVLLVLEPDTTPTLCLRRYKDESSISSMIHRECGKSTHFCSVTIGF